MTSSRKWTETDPDIGQFGRKVERGMYEFYTEGGTSSHPFITYNYETPEDAVLIDINDYAPSVIKDVLHTYGYYIDPEEALPENPNTVDMNISHWGKESQDWIIAECIYEQNYE